MPTETDDDLPRLLQKRRSMLRFRSAQYQILKLIVSLVCALAILISDHEELIYQFCRGVLQLLRY
jgi:hypothetical protein